MEEPLAKRQKLASCIICSSDPHFTGEQAKYTELVMDQFIHWSEKEKFSDKKRFNFCARCIELLEELLQLKVGLDLILKNIKDKENEIKCIIVNNSQECEDIVVKQFREVVTKAADPCLRSQIHDNEGSQTTADVNESILPIPCPLVIPKLEPINEDDDNCAYSHYQDCPPEEFQQIPNAQSGLPTAEFSSFPEFDDGTSMTSNDDDEDNDVKDILALTNAPLNPPNEDFSDTKLFLSSAPGDEVETYLNNKIASQVIEVLPNETLSLSLDTQKAGSSRQLGRGKSSITNIAALIMKPKSLALSWPRPPLSYTHLCILAIMSSDNMVLTIPEIYAFILENFPYFGYAKETWKNEVKTTLLSDYFRQIEHSSTVTDERMPPSNIKIMYTVSQQNISMMLFQMVRILSIQDIARSMASPDRLENFKKVLKQTENSQEFIDSKPPKPDQRVGRYSSSPGKKKSRRGRSAPIASQSAWPSPPLSFKQLCIVAIMNAPSQLASAPDMFDFITENYPYYGNMDESKLVTHKRILRTILGQSEFILFATLKDIDADLDEKQCVEQFGYKDSFQLIYTVNNSHVPDFRQIIIQNLYSPKNKMAIKISDYIEGYIQNVQQKIIAPSLPLYRRLKIQNKISKKHKKKNSTS